VDFRRIPVTPSLGVIFGLESFLSLLAIAQAQYDIVAFRLTISE
jgi:hypothetical protein